MKTWIEYAIIVGGIGQIFTAIIYPYIRHVVFGWYEDIKKLRPLNQQIAKTYGRYIQGLNFAFGLIAIIYAPDLIDGTPLAVALTGLIAAYWVGKIAVQFLHYPMYEIPKKMIFRIGEIGMNILFIYFAVLYTLLFVANLWEQYH
ncbi:hypothetical protein [Rubellicoccus peritrichatus]|uniref:Uncharacterized protein n=1 Tax=Rubellicoccus peritrichatus TaxID=3080537 RepID=A0AAQ3L975_9BACT|nr:hypothetical protein [Puniceicoccus sp. CR14]WOO40027.1 hypothetical protein RZN69_15495 [Puniceicoccus sp. CR14]